jgi:hypothetical protein
MLKSNPTRNPPTESPAGRSPANQPRTGRLAAAPTGDAAPGAFTGPIVPAGTGGNEEKRESPARRAHRQRMKDYFSRANSIS